VRELLKNAGFVEVQIGNDLAGNPRIASGRTKKPCCAN